MTESRTRATAESHSEIRFVNSRRKAFDFVIEPWAEVVRLEPGDELRCILYGPPGTPEIEVNDEALIVYAWEGTVPQLFLNGAEVLEYLAEIGPFPSLPGGFSTRSFVNFMFKPQEDEKA